MLMPFVQENGIEQRKQKRKLQNIKLWSQAEFVLRNRMNVI